MAFVSNLAKQAEAGRRSPASAPDPVSGSGAGGVERIWPESTAAEAPATAYPDLQTNPSFDIRHLMAEAEQIARRHWWHKSNKALGPDDYGTTPDGPAITWPEEQAGWSQTPPRSSGGSGGGTE